MPITRKPDSDPGIPDTGTSGRSWSAWWVLLALLPILLTLLGVALAATGGWLGIGLVGALQASMVAVLVRTADRPPPGRPGPPAAAVETAPVDDVARSFSPPVPDHS